MSCFRSVRNSSRSKLNIRVLFWVMPRFVTDPLDRPPTKGGPNEQAKADSANQCH